MASSILNGGINRCKHLLTLIYDKSEWNSQNCCRTLVYIFLNIVETSEGKCVITEIAFLP
jgi:hypothetical protein